MNLELNKIINKLNKIQGLTVIDILQENHRELIKSIEEKNNLGVLEAIKRQHTLLVLHDSSFRDPVGRIVINKNNQILFPVVPFPELNSSAINIVSSSPSEKVHKELIKDLNLNLGKDNATLLIGFDLQ